MTETASAQEMWNSMYRESPRRWTGAANVLFAEVVSSLTPGRALDLGCGEGGDAKWLAAGGWQVTAVDISDEALRRAAEDAGESAARITFAQHDLTRTFPEGEFDLVSAQFLQSPVDWDRNTLLRRAAAAVAPGGVFLLVDHGAPPPWSMHKHAHMHFPTPQEVLDGMALDPAVWEVLRADGVQRRATGPDGQEGTLLDNVIVVRRKG
ncbi:MAG: class SAM-dependent methyltransferase [Mycobacterium sp.]|jgi:SAM-dependent methyltransferase|nr:class SAM-dependent methyltransferase [Mycobacterium sp.]